MGTNSNKLKNNISISRGGDVPARKINAETGETDRSFAQPNPAVEHQDPAPKAHASQKDEAEALEKNSILGRKYPNDETKSED